MFSSARLAIATAIKERTDLIFAVGTGQVGWDDFTPPPMPETRSTLYAEVLRLAVTATGFVNPTTLADSPTPTNCIKVIGTIPAISTIDNTKIREKAIFLGGTIGAKDSGHIVHAESTALEVKVSGKAFQSILYITVTDI